MSRKNIEDLPPPHPKYRIDMMPRNIKYPFETRRKTENEDAARSVITMMSLPRKKSYQGKARELSDLLQPNLHGGTIPESLASSRYMRTIRIKVTGAILKLMASYPDQQVATATLIPRNCRMKPGKLMRWNIRAFSEALRADLNRCDAKRSDGFLLAFVHGEHESESGLLQPHWHLVAGGGMIDVVDRLRHLDKYALIARTPPGLDEDGVRRVVIKRGPFTNVASTVSYIVQSYWPNRWKGEVGVDRTRRGKTKQRIGGTTATEVLLALDSWRLKDICLLMKLRVTKAGLCQRNPASAYTNEGET